MSALSDLLKSKGKQPLPSKPKVNLPSKKGSALTNLLKNKGKQPELQPKSSVDSNGIVTNKFSDFLGGGVYKMKPGDPNANIKTERSNYGGLPTKTGYERADIFPVSLSGINEAPENITYEKLLPDVATKQALGEDLPVIKTATDKYLIEEILPKYKSGELSLREAQVKAVSYLRNEKEGLNKAMSKIDKGGIFGAFADDFVNTANKIGNFLGKKVGEIANKVVKDFGPEGRAEAEAKQKQMALNVQETQKKKAEELKIYSALPLNKKIAKTDPAIISRAKAASEALGREIKPENLQEEYAKLPQEQKYLVDKVHEEKTIEGLAKIATAPIRFTLGAIARDYAMTEDELKGYNEKFIPQSNFEKLIYGAEPITKLSESEDIYGLVAQNVGIPAAIGAMVALDLNIPGPKTLMKKYISEKIAKEGVEKVVKMGADEYIKVLDQAIKDEIKAGKITEEQVIEATAKAKRSLDEIKSGKSVEVSQTDESGAIIEPPVSPKIASSETKPKKTSILPPKTKTIKSEPDFRYHETSIKNLDSIKNDGLKPSNGQYGKGVYFAPEPGKQEATKVGVIIRVNKDELNKLDYNEFPEQGWTTKKVSPDVLEYSKDNGKTWNPLIEKASKKAIKLKDKILEPLEQEVKKYNTKKTKAITLPAKKRIELTYESDEFFDRFDNPKVKKVIVPNYLYHTTGSDNLESIKKLGLKRNINKTFTNTDNALYFAKDRDFDFAESFLGENETLQRFRINTSKLKKSDISFDDDIGGNMDDIVGSGSFKVFKDFKPTDVDIEVNGKWKNLGDFVNESKGFTNLPKRDIIEVKGLAKKAMELTKKNDGVTINLKGDIPTTGYVYSPSKTTEKIISVKALKTKDIEDYILEHYEELLDSKNHFGNWKNGDDFVMDISRVEKDLNKASIGAKAADQDGIFNLDNFETINRKDYEKFANNAKVKNARLPRKTDVKKGASKGLSGAGKKSTPVEGDKSRLTLPKKPVVKREPIEKPVDLRRKIKREKLIAEQSTPKKIQADAIEKGLIDMYKDIPEYDKMNMKDQAKKVFKLIDEDYDRAVRIALGKELPKDDVLPESVLIGVKNQALKDGDTDLLIRLATDEEGVAKGTTLLGQRIKALDEGMEYDAFRNIRRVVENRKKNMTEKGAKEAKNIKAKARKIIEEAKPNKYDWQNLVKEITCK